MNRNFASIDADRKFTFAPDGVIYDGRFHTRPTAEMYAAMPVCVWTMLKEAANA